MSRQLDRHSRDATYEGCHIFSLIDVVTSPGYVRLSSKKQACTSTTCPAYHDRTGATHDPMVLAGRTDERAFCDWSLASRALMASTAHVLTQDMHGSSAPTCWMACIECEASINMGHSRSLCKACHPPQMAPLDRGSRSLGSWIAWLLWSGPCSSAWDGMLAVIGVCWYVPNSRNERLSMLAHAGATQPVGREEATPSSGSAPEEATAWMAAVTSNGAKMQTVLPLGTLPIG